MKVDVVEEFIKLASINSPSRREGQVAGHLLGRFREMGLAPVGRIANQSPSKMDLDFIVKGKAAHAGRPEKGINAIAAASSAIARIKSGRIDEDTTANIGMISGGKARNIVPDRAEV